MKLADRIKFECFCAFVHSRLVNAGTFEEGVPILSDEEIINTIDKSCDKVIELISTYGTIEIINKKISTGPSVIISNMYHSNYTKMLNIMEKHIKKDEECIMPLVGIGMIISYLENDKNKIKLKEIEIKEVENMYYIFEREMEDKKLRIKMMKTGADITEGYFR